MAIMWHCLRYPMCSRFSRTRTQTRDYSRFCASIASHGKEVTRRCMQDSSDIIISLHTECMLTPLLLLPHLMYLEYSYLCLTCALLQCIRRNAFCGIRMEEKCIFDCSQLPQRSINWILGKQRSCLKYNQIQIHQKEHSSDLWDNMLKTSSITATLVAHFWHKCSTANCQISSLQCKKQTVAIYRL